MRFFQRGAAAILALCGVNQALSAEQKQDLTEAAYQSAPGLTAAASTTAFGWPLSAWLTLVSIIYVVLQVAHLIWKWRRQARIDQQRRTRGEALQSTDQGQP